MISGPTRSMVLLLNFSSLMEVKINFVTTSLICKQVEFDIFQSQEFELFYPFMHFLRYFVKRSSFPTI